MNCLDIIFTYFLAESKYPRIISEIETVTHVYLSFHVMLGKNLELDTGHSGHWTYYTYYY